MWGCTAGDGRTFCFRSTGWARLASCQLRACGQVSFVSNSVCERHIQVHVSAIFLSVSPVADMLLLSLLNRMPPLFAAAIGFKPSPAALAHANAVLPLLEASQPLHFGSQVSPLDSHITRLFIASVRVLLACADYQAAPADFDAAALVGATAAAAAAADALAAAASAPDTVCVSVLHSAGLFSFLGECCFVFPSHVLTLLQRPPRRVLFSRPLAPSRAENLNYPKRRAHCRCGLRSFFFTRRPPAHVSHPSLAPHAVVRPSLPLSNRLLPTKRSGRSPMVNGASSSRRLLP